MVANLHPAARLIKQMAKRYLIACNGLMTIPLAPDLQHDKNQRIMPEQCVDAIILNRSVEARHDKNHLFVHWLVLAMIMIAMFMDAMR
jgi:hypothetical protein